MKRKSERVHHGVHLKARFSIKRRAREIKERVIRFVQDEAVRRNVLFAAPQVDIDQPVMVQGTNILSGLEHLCVLNASRINLKTYINNVIDMICALVSCDVVSVTLFDVSSGKINYRYVTGRDGEFIEPEIIELEERHIEQAFKIQDHVLTHHRDAKLGIATIVSFPLHLRGHQLGAISLLFKRPVEIEASLLSGIKICASNLALMVQNVQLYSSIAGNHFNIIRALIISLEARDRYTHGHSQRVTDYAYVIAKQMKCSRKELRIIQEVAPLHDIGKISIPDATLNKVGRLTDEEFNEIKSHALKGSIMLETLGFDKDSVQLVRWHHEAFDGKGYPDRLKGDEIPLVARILCVADAYDAMTSDRPYRKRMTREMAHAEIRRCSGAQFCPQVVEAFFASQI